MLGCSTGWPASIDHARRTNCACDHASGVADSVPSPLGKPGVPDGGWSSHTCSCGYVFEADVTTSVTCPHCGGGQAW